MAKTHNLNRAVLYSPPALLLFLFVSADVAFIALHVLSDIGSTDQPLYEIDEDSSYAAAFQDIKLFWLVLLLSLVSSATRTLLYAAWAALFAYVLTDDLLGLTELIGGWVAPRLAAFGEGFVIASETAGQLVVLGAAAVIVPAAAVLLYRVSGWDARSVSKDLLLLSLVLLFFDGFLDVVQATVSGGPIRHLLIVLEDGGEMIVLSLMAAYAFGLWLRGGYLQAARQ